MTYENKRLSKKNNLSENDYLVVDSEEGTRAIKASDMKDSFLKYTPTLNGSGTLITANEDLKSDKFLVPGNYICNTNSVAATLINLPSDLRNSAFHMVVDAVIGDPFLIKQTFIHHVHNTVVIRRYNHGANTKWSSDETLAFKSDLDTVGSTDWTSQPKQTNTFVQKMSAFNSISFPTGTKEVELYLNILRYPSTTFVGNPESRGSIYIYLPYANMEKQNGTINFLIYPIYCMDRAIGVYFRMYKNNAGNITYYAEGPLNVAYTLNVTSYYR